MGKCKYCGMPTKEVTHSPSRLEMSYYERTLPAILKELENISKSLEKISDIEPEQKMQISKFLRHLMPSRHYGNMLGSDFFKTKMGQRFFTSTIPSILKELRSLNGNLEQINKI